MILGSPLIQRIESQVLLDRLLKNLPIQDQNDSTITKEEIGGMTHFLFNKDLAKEVAVGDLGSVINVQTIYIGLRCQMKG